jgi:hypothetical protein
LKKGHRDLRERQERNMTKRVFAIVAVSFLLIAAAAPLAAQGSRMTANIPFEFTVAGKTMPAGEYEVWKTPTSSAIVVRGLNQRTSAMSVAMRDPVTSRDPAADTRLIFNQYGNEYFLHAVVNAYAAVEFSLPQLQAERELVKTAELQQEEVHAVLARR